MLNEAQSIPNIGPKLKLLIDSFPEIRIIATGSSSFGLANNTAESLTGRKYQFILYPLSIYEIASYYGQNYLPANTSNYLRHGLYPSIFRSDHDTAQQDLAELSGSYLFKDILQYREIKSPDVLRKILQALALQVGQIVSYNELAGLVGVDKNTVSKYLDLLEKSFIIFRLNPFSRNLRKELNKNRKIYFYDLGIRNALINNFNPPELRADMGGVWENFCVLERKKFLNNSQIMRNQYFWRTYSGQEIDLIEEYSGKFSVFEFKYGQKKVNIPSTWLKNYPNSKSQVVTPTNYFELLGGI